MWQTLQHAMEITANLEHEHVHKVYSKIATHFSDTRFKPWPRIAQFLNEQPASSLIADIGCGNGKYLGVNPSTYCLGSDICPELVCIAKSRGHEVGVCDCLHLPYKTGLFDAVICIAVIHHLSTEERRLAALREMLRVLTNGGHVLVYVWALEQDRKQFEAQDVMVPWHLQPKYMEGTSQDQQPTARRRCKSNEKVRERKRLKKAQKKLRKAEATVQESAEVKCEEDDPQTQYLLGELSAIDLSNDENEMKTKTEQGLEKHDSNGLLFNTETIHTHVDTGPNKEKIPTIESAQNTSPHIKDDSSANANKELLKGYQTFQRYYHVFKRGELVQLFSKCSDVIVLEEFYDHENWCVIARKT